MSKIIKTKKEMIENEWAKFKRGIEGFTLYN